MAILNTDEIKIQVQGVINYLKEKRYSIAENLAILRASEDAFLTELIKKELGGDKLGNKQSNKHNRKAE